MWNVGTMTLFFRVFLVLTILSTLLPAQVTSAQLTNIRLEIESFRESDGTEVSFNVIPESPEIVPFVDTTLWVGHDAGDYTVFIDEGGIRANEERGRFIYPFYVKKKASSGAIDDTEIALFNVWISSTFKDTQGKKLIFHVWEQGQSDKKTGEIDVLPLHAYNYPGDRETQDMPVQTIDLFSTSKISLTWKNSSKLPLEISEVTYDDSEYHAEYWQQFEPSIRLNLPKLQPEQEKPVKIATLTMRLNPFEILTLPKMWIPSTDEAPHETIDIMVTMRNGLKGRERIGIIPVKVRFVPFWGLFAVAGIGALLGSVIAVFYLRTQKWTWMFVGTIMGIVVEGLGWASKGEVGIGGLNMNAKQLLPAILIGFFVGLTGFKIFPPLKGLLERTTGRQQPVQQEVTAD